MRKVERKSLATDFNPKVSIIIPVYNGSNYLSEAIDSALKQTYKNVEIIVINDGSNDNRQTETIARGYGKRIKYFEKSNGGVASALNFGIREMKGDYFSWLSHDDLYTPEKIMNQISFIKEIGRDDVIVYCDYVLINDKDEQVSLKKLGSINERDFRFFITKNNTFYGCTLLIPRKCFDPIGLFNESLKTTQDYDMWFRLAEFYDFVYSEGFFVKQRIHSEQCTKKIPEEVISECNNLMINFVNNMSYEELRRGASTRFLFISYLKLLKSFHLRKFYKARNSTFLKIIESIFNYSLSKKVLSKKFIKYYRENVFRSSESRSGEGSTIEQTEIIRKELPNIFNKFGVRTVLDAPCGDLNWIKKTDLSGIDYTGVDIVPEIIENNKKNYGYIGRFHCFDIASDKLPCADLILCRDCLVHLTFSQALKAVKNMKKSGAKYFLTTSFISREKNEKLVGEWRVLNLEKSPFNFGPPVFTLNEECSEGEGQYTDKSLCLWKFKDIDL